MTKTILACTSCQARLNVSAIAPGKKIRCPKCQTILTIPAPKIPHAESTIIDDTPLQHRAQSTIIETEPEGLGLSKAPVKPKTKPAATPPTDDGKKKGNWKRGLATGLFLTSGIIAAGTGVFAWSHRERLAPETPAAPVVTPVAPAPAKTARPPAAPPHDPKEEFRAAFDKRLARAHRDIRATYDLAQLAKRQGLTDLYDKAMHMLVENDPRHSNSFITGTVLPELGYVSVTYHERAPDCPAWDERWTEKRGWFLPEEAKPWQAKEKEYRSWLDLPEVKKKRELLARVATPLGMQADEFALHLTPHYAIVIQRHERYDMPRAFADYEALLEKFYAAYYDYFAPYATVAPMRQPEPGNEIVFVLFSDDKQYHARTRAPREFAGHYDLRSRVLYTHKTNRQELETIFHEGTHQLSHFSSSFYDMPAEEAMTRVAPWYYEGLAEFFGAIRRDPDSGEFRWGEVSRLRLPIIQRSLADNPELRMEDLLGVDYNTLNADIHRHAPLSYAGGWSIVYFFLTHDGGRYRGDFMRFVRSAQDGHCAAADFLAIFEPHGMDKLNREWRESTLALRAN